MAFSEEVMAAALERSGGRCECNRGSCATHYLSRCPTSVSKVTAMFHKKKAVTFGDADGLNNCEVLCQTCHANTGMDAFSSSIGSHM